MTKEITKSWHSWVTVALVDYKMIAPLDVDDEKMALDVHDKIMSLDVGNQRTARHEMVTPPDVGDEIMALQDVSNLMKAVIARFYKQFPWALGSNESEIQVPNQVTEVIYM